jgi:sarcosine oxidase
MGSAIAYFLLANPDFEGRVLVVERDPSYRDTATARSWGGMRQQFSVAENIEMSLFGLDFIKAAPELLAVNGEVPDFQFHDNGYLFLATAEGIATLQNNISLQQSLGGAVDFLTPDALTALFPWLALDDVAGGAYGGNREGWVDPYALLQAFRKKARALGACYVEDDVVAVHRQDERVVAAELKTHGRVACGLLVNAAGPQAGAVAALAGVELPVRPRKRMSYVFSCREALPPLPLTVDCSGLGFRPEGPNYIAIKAPPEDEDPDSNDLNEEYESFEEIIWPILATRVPAFEAIKLQSAWAGHYDYNIVDQNAVIGAHPEIAGLYFCNGFSGHGLQQSPAAGRALAEKIVYGAFRTIDLGRLDFARLAEGRPVKEANVV